MGLNDRLNRLEWQIPDPEYRKVKLFYIHSPALGELPEWADVQIKALARSQAETLPLGPGRGVLFIDMERDDAGRIITTIDKGAWHVTPDGCAPLEAADEVG